MTIYIFSVRVRKRSNMLKVVFFYHWAIPGLFLSNSFHLWLIPPLWPDWAIFWTLGNFSKPLATVNLPNSPTFLGNFCIGVKIYHFSSEIFFGQFLQSFGDFFLVTLDLMLYISIVYDWNRTADLLGRKRPLYQLCHNHCRKSIQFNRMVIYLRSFDMKTV